MSSRRLQRNNFSSSKTSSRSICKTSSRPVLLISSISCFHWMFLQLFRIQFFRHRLSHFYYCSSLSEITFSLWLLRLSWKTHFYFCCFDGYYYLKISKQRLPLMSWMNNLKIQLKPLTDSILVALKSIFKYYFNMVNCLSSTTKKKVVF